MKSFFSPFSLSSVPTLAPTVLALLAFAVVACEQGASNTDSSNDAVEIRKDSSLNPFDCLRELKDVADIQKAASAALGVPTSCRVNSPHPVTSKRDGAARYYLTAAVRCEPGAAPDARAASAFSATMDARGFHGWSYVDGVVIGETSSTACEPVPQKKACEADAKETARLEGMAFAALNVTTQCRAEVPLKWVERNKPDGFYFANVACSFDSPPSAKDRASAAARFKALGYNDEIVLTETGFLAHQTSQVCSSY